MTNSLLIKDAELRVSEIAACIYKEMKINPFNTMQGICGENFGCLLFLFYYPIEPTARNGIAQ